MSNIISIAFALAFAISTAATSISPSHAFNLPQQATYIVNTNTDRFHTVHCSHGDSIKEKNRWEYAGPREYLIERGYVPCKVCNP